MKKVKAIHDRSGFVGQIADEETYDGVKSGKLDWKPHVKAHMKSVQIPMDLFYRLMELDRGSGTAEDLPADP